MRSPTGLFRCSYRPLVRWRHRSTTTRGTGHERHQDSRRKAATASRNRRRRARGTRRRRCCSGRIASLGGSPQPQNQAIAADAAGQLGVSPTRTDRRDQEGDGRPDRGAGHRGHAHARPRRRPSRRASPRPTRRSSPSAAATAAPAMAVTATARRRPDRPSTRPRRTSASRPADLRTQLEAGKTLAAIATANGKTADGLKAALTTAAKSDLDAAVTAGKLTQAQEDKILAALPSAPRRGDQRGPHRRPRRSRRPAAAPRRARNRRPDLADSSRQNHDLPPLRAPAGHAPPGLGAFGRLRQNRFKREGPC